MDPARRVVVGQLGNLPPGVSGSRGRGRGILTGSAHAAAEDEAAPWTGGATAPPRADWMDDGSDALTAGGDASRSEPEHRMSRTPKMIGLVVAIVVVVAAVIVAPAIGDALFASNRAPATTPSDLGFAVNDAGETYGSASGDSVPDLLAAQTDEGAIGYVRVSELDLARNVAGSVDEGEWPVDVYEKDGETVIGRLTVTKDMPGPRDGQN